MRSRCTLRRKERSEWSALGFVDEPAPPRASGDAFEILVEADFVVEYGRDTRAVRSSSYHQAAEQTWNYCLAVAQNGELAEILARRAAGGPLDPVEQNRAGAADQAMIYGLENMMRAATTAPVPRPARRLLPWSWIAWSNHRPSARRRRIHARHEPEMQVILLQ